MLPLSPNDRFKNVKKYILQYYKKSFPTRIRKNLPIVRVGKGKTKVHFRSKTTCTAKIKHKLGQNHRKSTI